VSGRSVSTHRSGAVRRWSIATVSVSLLASLAIFLLDANWSAGPTRHFLVGVGIVLAVQFGVLWSLLSPVDPTSSPRSITLASWVTIARGVPIALLAGFLLVPPPTGAIAWVPGMLFAIAVAFDAIDGTIARARNDVSELGDRLDGEIDSIAIFVGTAVCVAHGHAPSAFLLIGLAHYGFLLGIAVRRRLGWSLDDLEPSQFRRAVGATTMLTIWILLLPVSPGRIQPTLVSLLFVPFSISFLRDWLAISGHIEP
jgi:CDP-diacylglycerol--glycerol-3-phosphate 3-phosphatidyltransferase